MFANLENRIDSQMWDGDNLVNVSIDGEAQPTGQPYDIVYYKTSDGAVCSASDGPADKAGWGNSAQQVSNTYEGGVGTIKFSRWVDRTPISAWTGQDTIVEVDFSENVYMLNSDTFKGCTSLQKVVAPKVERIIGSVFSGCTNLSAFTIPSTITVIRAHAFKGCKKYKEDVVLPEGLKYIWQHAFWGSGINSISIPSTVVTLDSSYDYAGDNEAKIGSGMCYNCKSLVSAYIDCTCTCHIFNSGCTSLTTVEIGPNAGYVDTALRLTPMTTLIIHGNSNINTDRIPDEGNLICDPDWQYLQDFITARPLWTINGVTPNSE